MDKPDFDIDLGDNHFLKWYGWKLDRSIQSNAERFVGIPDCDKFGVSIIHKTMDGAICEGFCTIDGEVQRLVNPGVAKWSVESWEPLTLSPSVLCNRCGDHGFVRNGKWVHA